MKDETYNIFEDWVYIYDLKPSDITEEVTVVNVDTRDFHLFCRKEPVTRDYYKECSGLSKKDFRAFDFINDEKCKPEFLIDRSNIIDWLRYIEVITRDCPNGMEDWRNFDFNINYKSVTGWDFKYLRIFKHLHIPDKFVVCTDCLVPVEYGLLTEKTVIKY